MAEESQKTFLEKRVKPPEATIDDYREALEDMVIQFGSRGHKEGRLVLSAGGLGSLEYAFRVLGWSDPKPIPEYECQLDGCYEEASCGVPTDDGYKWLCSKHYREVKR